MATAGFQSVLERTAEASTGTPGENPRVAWRALAVLWFCGAGIGALSLVLPHPAEFNDGGIWTNIVLAALGGVACLLAADRLPLTLIGWFIFAGTLAATRAVYLSNDPSSYYTFFYIWIGPYAFLFLGRRAGLVQMAAVGAAYGWALTRLDATTPLALWLMVIGTTTVCGALIDVLVTRMRQTVAESARIAHERAQLLARLELVARTDDLTGLPNRRSWNEELDREIARAGRDATPLCVAVIDLDHFKVYNDNHGHQAGDRLLKEIAASWRRHLRSTDILARYGGEEFALALPACDLDAAALLLDRLRQAMPSEQTCSAGVAAWSTTETADALVGRADDALYQAKAAGRDRVVGVS